MRLRSEVSGKLSGRLRIEENGILIVDSRNMITDASEEIIQGLLGRNAEDYLLDYIAIGKGGDCDIFPGSHVDTGARVAPDPGEREIRVLVERLPIQITAPNPPEFTLYALANPAQAVDPDINEFGILARNGLLFAHYVTELDLFNRASKKPKTDVNWIIEWTVRYENA
jgi:hypothetical protein